MAAAREEGLIKFVAVNPQAGSEVVLGYKDTRELAPTGKIAEPDQWYKFPLAPFQYDGTNGWELHIVMKSEASDALDNANDSIVKIPAVINGVPTTIGKKEFQMKTGQDFASPNVTADVDSIIGVYKIPAGTIVRLGGAKGWFETYDDTA